MITTIPYNKLVKQHLQILKNLEYESGLFSASKKESTTGYNAAWLRDNFYTGLAFERFGDWETVRKTYRAILNILLKHEYKIDWAINKKPTSKHEYIHPRYHPETFDEFWNEWGSKQNDSIGSVLFKIGELEHVKGIKIIENDDDKRIVQKLVDYLASIEYWHDEDSGIWENEEEVHASSIGACVAGLEMIKHHTHIMVPKQLIDKGRESLNRMLPRESKKKFVDLALLSLIYPYNLVTKNQAKEILRNVEYHLVKRKGVIRYRDDWYYNRNPDGHSEEAEWTFGFSWLAIIYEQMGNKKKANHYVKKAMKTLTKEGIPELYYSHMDMHNENVPLGWAESLFIVAVYNINEKHIKIQTVKYKKTKHNRKREVKKNAKGCNKR